MNLDRYPLRRSVIVNTKTGRAFRGVAWARKGPYLVLRNAMLHEEGGPIAVDGEVLIERSNIDFIQVIESVQ